MLPSAGFKQSGIGREGGIFRGGRSVIGRKVLGRDSQAGNRRLAARLVRPDGPSSNRSGSAKWRAILMLGPLSTMLKVPEQDLQTAHVLKSLLLSNDFEQSGANHEDKIGSRLLGSG